MTIKLLSLMDLIFCVVVSRSNSSSFYAIMHSCYHKHFQLYDIIDRFQEMWMCKQCVPYHFLHEYKAKWSYCTFLRVLFGVSNIYLQLCKYRTVSIVLLIVKPSCFIYTDQSNQLLLVMCEYLVFLLLIMAMVKFKFSEHYSGRNTTACTHHPYHEHMK